MSFNLSLCIHTLYPGIFTLKSCDLSITQINPISCLYNFFFFFYFFLLYTLLITQSGIFSIRNTSYVQVSSLLNLAIYLLRKLIQLVAYLFFFFSPFICPFNYPVTRTQMLARFVDVLSSGHIQHGISVSKLRMHMRNLSIHVNCFHDWFLFLFSPRIGYISITKPKLTWNISVVYQRGELHSQYCNSVCVLN